MKLIYSFFFVGFICLIASIIYDKTNLSIGHITSLFVVIGTLLGLFNIYDNISKYIGYGANLPIISFGNALLNYCYIGFKEKGILGLLTGMLKTTSGGISATIIGSLFISLFCKVKD